jgi:hypothetical protein
VKKHIQIALLGSLWGLLECLPGTWLHLANLPFIGAILMSLGMLFLILARYSTGMRGSCLYVASVTCFLKLLFAGGAAISPILGILIQSVLIEAAFWHSQPIKLRYLVGGMIGVSYSLFHPFLTLGLFGGWKILAVYAWLITTGSTALGLDSSLGITIIAFLLILHLTIGAAAALAALELIRLLEQRGFKIKYSSAPEKAFSEPSP